MNATQADINALLDAAAALQTALGNLADNGKTTQDDAGDIQQEQGRIAMLVERIGDYSANEFNQKTVQDATKSVKTAITVVAPAGGGVPTMAAIENACAAAEKALWNSIPAIANYGPPTQG
ncbi:hypothetical protein ACFFJT_17760 [Dyella flava]|uniref:Uncharacterized protein n=1 Tax=Dyella flava TaxID=1920170 RepID=A0ABS2K082_9GAMM|nr:hypothetical protein [Dyella flava]